MINIYIFYFISSYKKLLLLFISLVKVLKSTVFRTFIGIIYYKTKEVSEKKNVHACKIVNNIYGLERQSLEFIAKRLCDYIACIQVYKATQFNC